MEEQEGVELSIKEMEKLNEILSLQRELEIIEIKESFKLGFKEAYIYFESMDMIKI